MEQFLKELILNEISSRTNLIVRRIRKKSEDEIPDIKKKTVRGEVIIKTSFYIADNEAYS